MPTVVGENLVPWGPGHGAATILRNDLTPLHILQRGDAVRAAAAKAEAAARQKQAQELARQWAEDRKLNLDTGGLFQQSFNDYTANAQDVLGKYYTDAEAGRTTTSQAAQQAAAYKNEVERERLLGVDKDKTLAAYESNPSYKPYRDLAGLHTAIGLSVLNPDNTRVRASQYDERGRINDFDKNAATYDAQAYLKDYYAAMQARTVADAEAGRVGGIHSAHSFTSKGIIPVRQADGSWAALTDAKGKYIVNRTAADLEDEMASNHLLNMSVSRLVNDYKARQAATPGLPDRTPLQLFQDASQNYVSFRQQGSAGRNAAAPRPRAAATSATFAPIEQVPLNETNLNATTGGQVPGVVPGPDGGIDPAFANVFGVRGQRQQVAASGEFAQPLIVKKSGEKVPVKTDGFAPNEYFREGADGQLQRVKNNKQPMAGIHGPAKGVYVDTKTGDLLPVQTKAEGDALVASGKADLRLGISFYGDKNENFTADKSRIKKELLAQRNADDEPKYTEVTAEAKAAELASRGVSRNIHLYNDQDARTLNATTGPAYGEYAKQLQAEQARLRANHKPATNPGGSIYKRPTASPASAAPSRGGSIYKTR